MKFWCSGLNVSPRVFVSPLVGSILFYNFRVKCVVLLYVVSGVRGVVFVLETFNLS